MSTALYTMRNPIPLLAILLLTTALAAACGSSRQTGNEAPTPPAADPGTVQQQGGSEEDEMEVEGTLAPTVEAGGWVLNSEDKTYLLLGVEEYRNQPWFKEGARVKVWGRESPDTITIFMQGMPFRVSRMEPAEGA